MLRTKSEEEFYNKFGIEALSPKLDGSFVPCSDHIDFPLDDDNNLLSGFLDGSLEEEKISTITSEVTNTQVNSKRKFCAENETLPLESSTANLMAEIATREAELRALRARLFAQKQHSSPQIFQRLNELDACVREKQFFLRNNQSKQIISELSAERKNEFEAEKGKVNLGNFSTFFSKSANELFVRINALKEKNLELEHAKHDIQASIEVEKRKLTEKVSSLVMFSPACMPALIEGMRVELYAKETTQEKIELMALILVLEENLKRYEKRVSDNKANVASLLEIQDRLLAENRLIDNQLLAVCASTPSNK